MPIIPLFLLAAFIAVLAVAWSVMRRDQDGSLHWPEAAGTVVAVEAEPAVGRGTGRRTSEETWRPLVVYDYEVDGRRYTGERLTLSPEHARMSRGEVDEMLRFYHPGMPIRVRYDPRRPDRAVLIPGRG